MVLPIKNFLPRGKRGVDWAAPNTLVVIILAVLLGLAFLVYVWKLRGNLLP